MRHLVVFLDKCLQVFVVLLCVLAHLLFGWQFVVLFGHLGQERLARARSEKSRRELVRLVDNLGQERLVRVRSEDLRWYVKPYDLEYRLFQTGKISNQAHFVEWRPVTKEMWDIYNPESSKR